MFQVISGGIAIGCIYALIAIGFVLIYNAVGAVNFAQGDLLVVGSYLGVLGVSGLHWPLWAAAALVILGSVVLGLLFQALTYYPLRDRPPVNLVISCLGAGIFLRNAVQIVGGPEPFTMKPFSSTAVFELFGITIPSQNLIIIVITVVALCAQACFFSFTATGRMLRATASDRYAARLCGIPVRRMIALTFVVGTIFAGVAGFLVVPIFLASPNMGSNLIIKAWVGVILGGFGNLYGAVLGGVLVGIIETCSAVWVSSAYRDVITMMLLLAVLFVRPQGIFKSAVAEKV